MDEPFHAHVAEWIARNGGLPRELPEFYSGLPTFYPRLLHLIAAGVLLLLRWRATAAPRDAALTGVVVSLALTAKQIAPLFAALLALLASLLLYESVREARWLRRGTRSSCWPQARCSSPGCQTTASASTCRPGCMRTARRSIVRSRSRAGF